MQYTPHICVTEGAVRRTRIRGAFGSESSPKTAKEPFLRLEQRLFLCETTCALPAEIPAQLRPSRAQHIEVFACLANCVVIDCSAQRRFILAEHRLRSAHG